MDLMNYHESSILSLLTRHYINKTPGTTSTKPLWKPPKVGKSFNFNSSRSANN